MFRVEYGYYSDGDDHQFEEFDDYNAADIYAAKLNNLHKDDNFKVDVYGDIGNGRVVIITYAFQYYHIIRGFVNLINTDLRNKNTEGLFQNVQTLYCCYENDSKNKSKNKISYENVYAYYHSIIDLLPINEMYQLNNEKLNAILDELKELDNKMNIKYGSST